jgi:hypothetical protein
MIEGQSLIPDNINEVKYYRDFCAGKKLHLENKYHRLEKTI